MDAVWDANFSNKRHENDASHSYSCINWEAYECVLKPKTIGMKLDMLKEVIQSVLPLHQQELRFSFCVSGYVQIVKTNPAKE